MRIILQKSEIWYTIIQFDSTEMNTPKGFYKISVNYHNLRDITLQKAIYFLAKQRSFQKLWKLWQ